MGYGYVDTDVQISTAEDLEPYLKVKEATYHTNKILSSYLRNPAEKKLVILEKSTTAVVREPDPGRYTEGLFAL
jgi:DNA polymerase III subunit epsilon